MEEAKAFSVQKQVKDNTQDLQSEFLDMKNWERHMRQKDRELSKLSRGEEILPPIRNKKKKPIVKSDGKQKEPEKKPKRIKSCDYNSWEKFDVDKVCEDLDKEVNSDGSVEEGVSKEQLEKDHEEATNHKQQGNVFVQEQKWDKAVACYSEAIKIFPYDAVFFANRALCHLKMDNLYSAEADCTAALQLDEEYIKAYHRRATARIGLKQYKEAKQDLEKILKLEPSNKEAKSLVAQVNKKIESSQALTISEEDEKVKVPLEKRIAEKMFASSNTSKKDSGRETEKKICVVGEKPENERDSRIPDWLPEKDNVAVVEPIVKPAHLRSKKPLTRIPVEEVDFSTMNFNEPSNDQSYTKEPCTEVSNVIAENEQKQKYVPDNNKDKLSHKDTANEKDDPTKNIESVETDQTKNVTEIPIIPKTAVQFMMDWRRCKLLDFRYAYLKQLPPMYLFKVFQESMETDIFSEILLVLQSEFMKRKDPVLQRLVDLSQVKRFRALIMFMSNADKKVLQDLFDYCKVSEGIPENEINELRDKYEL